MSGNINWDRLAERVVVGAVRHVDDVTAPLRRELVKLAADVAELRGRVAALEDRQRSARRAKPARVRPNGTMRQ